MDDRMLITPDVMQDVLNQIESLPPRTPPPALVHEDLLRAFIEEQVLKLVGRLALFGAIPPLVKRAAHDVDHLVAVCVSAVHEGNRRLIDQLLPEIDEQQNKQCHDESSGAPEVDG